MSDSTFIVLGAMLGTLFWVAVTLWEALWDSRFQDALHRVPGEWPLLMSARRCRNDPNWLAERTQRDKGGVSEEREE